MIGPKGAIRTGDKVSLFGNSNAGIIGTREPPSEPFLIERMAINGLGMACESIKSSSGSGLAGDLEITPQHARGCRTAVKIRFKSFH